MVLQPKKKKNQDREEKTEEGGNTTEQLPTARGSRLQTLAPASGLTCSLLLGGGRSKGEKNSFIALTGIRGSQEAKALKTGPPPLLFLMCGL